MDLYGDQHYVNEDGMKCVRQYRLMKRFNPGSGSAVVLRDRMDAQTAISAWRSANGKAAIGDDVFLLED